jgi:hypothetical protein
MRTSWVFFGCLFLLVALFVLWYSISADYGDSVAEGVYYFAQDIQTSTLVLRSDHVFQQELREGGKLEHASGTWRRVGEGSIIFSKGFLTISGQERGADGIAVADMRKKFGVFVSLEFRQYHVQWYERIDPPAPDLVSGAYTADGDWGAARLLMRADRTFEQTTNSGGVIKRASGNWSTDQSGNIVFSKDFLKCSGEALASDETATAMNPKDSNLQVSVTSNSGVPTFRKKQFF